MYPAVAEILMPAADRAIAALAEMQQGFFINRQRGEDEVVFHLPNGQTESRSPENAVALAAEGFSQRDARIRRQEGRQRRALIDHSLFIT